MTHAPVVSYGLSEIGFVNFGAVGDFVAETEIVTYGLSTRGFNQVEAAGGIKMSWSEQVCSNQPASAPGPILLPTQLCIAIP